MCAYMTLRMESTAAYHVNGNNLFIHRQIRASAVNVGRGDVLGIQIKANAIL